MASGSPSAVTLLSGCRLWTLVRLGAEDLSGGLTGLVCNGSLFGRKNPFFKKKNLPQPLDTCHNLFFFS